MNDNNRNEDIGKKEKLSRKLIDSRKGLKSCPRIHWFSTRGLPRPGKKKN
jgi:hypothetical protein